MKVGTSSTAQEFGIHNDTIAKPVEIQWLITLSPNHPFPLVNPRPPI